MTDDAISSEGGSQDFLRWAAGTILLMIVTGVFVLVLTWLVAASHGVMP